jgi:uncharacterized protein YoxC
MLWQFGISLAAIAFVALVVFVIHVLVELLQTIRLSREAIVRVESQLAHKAEEALKVIQGSQQLLDDIQSRLKATDGFILAMRRTGETSASLSQSILGISRLLSDSIIEVRSSLHSQQDTVRNLITLTTLGTELWHKWQTSKSSKAASHTNEQP